LPEMPRCLGCSSPRLGGLGRSGRAPPKRIPSTLDAETEPSPEARRSEAQVVLRIPYNQVPEKGVALACTESSELEGVQASQTTASWQVVCDDWHKCRRRESNP
jgi:hypothetical protein